jgi:integrase/recombinase XerC
MAEYNYAKQKQKKNIEDTVEMLKEMPGFINYYYKSNVLALSASSQHSYMYDIYNFLKWWHSSLPELQEKELKEMQNEDIAKVTPNDVLDYITYMRNESETFLSESTLARRCAALNNLFTYLEQYGIIETNPMVKVKRPKIKKDKRIIRLEDEEVERYFDSILNGTGFTEHQRKYLENTKQRDYTIATLLLTSGIRVSEMVGLNIEDVSFTNCRIQITRKGGKKQYIPLSDDTLDVLKEYLAERKKVSPALPEDETALFLSTQNTRMTTAAVQNLIKKYAKAAGIDKPITPHKLRKTYGTNLYNKTRDIYLVANALGHDSVVTTTKHYVASDEEDLVKVRNL